MKHYRVIFTPTAQLHAMQAMEFIALDSPVSAAHWYEGLAKAIDALLIMPGGYGLARENGRFPEEVRQYIYHSHRIIFRIDEPAGIVYILYIRHAARRAIAEPDEE